MYGLVMSQEKGELGSKTLAKVCAVLGNVPTLRGISSVQGNITYSPPTIVCSCILAQDPAHRSFAYVFSLLDV